MEEKRSNPEPVRSSGRPSPEPGPRWFIQWLSVVATLFVAWWLVSSFLVPELLRAAHQGRAIPLLSDLMAGRDSTPLEAYLDSWKRLAWGAGAGIAILGIAALPLGFASPGVGARLRRGGGGRVLTDRGLGLLLVGALLAVAGLVVLLAYVHPVAFVHAITEDYWVEYGTAVAFFVASLLFLRAACSMRGTRVLGPLAFGLVAFLVAMEEISWGQRILGLGTPAMLEAYNFQGELTLHNIWFPKHGSLGLAVAAFALMAPWVAGRGGRLGPLLDRMGVPVPRPHLVPLFLAAAGLLVLSDMAPVVWKLDEVSELAVGLCALLLGLDMAMRAGTRLWPNTRAALFSGAGAVAVVALLTAGMVHLTPNPWGLTNRLNEFAVEGYPNAGLYDQAEALFEYLERNPERRTRATRLAYARLLLQRNDVERAERVLAAALRDQRDAPADWPSAVAEARRNEGEIYTLLGRTEEAEAAFRAAVAVDRGRLHGAEEPSERASIHWSLARTFKASGNRRGAAAQAAMACELTHERRMLHHIRQWKSRKEMSDTKTACDPSIMSVRMFAGPDG